jgi:hypothetical protein
MPNLSFGLLLAATVCIVFFRRSLWYYGHIAEAEDSQPIRMHMAATMSDWVAKLWQPMQLLLV